MSVFLGVDIGSSSIKGGILDLAASTVTHVAQLPFPEPADGLPAGYFEVDPLAIVSTTRQLIEQLLPKTHHVDAIVFSCQMGGLILADQNRNPVTRYLSWRDQRTTQPLTGKSFSLFAELQERTDSGILTEIGNELRPGSAVSLLYWLVRTGNLPAQAVTAMNPGDFVVAALCGAVPVTEPTMALGSLDLRSGTLHKSWLSELGLGSLRWPEIVQTETVVGEYSAGNERIPCFPAVGDHQASLLGAGLQPEELSINISTGSQVSCLTAAHSPGNYQTRPFFGGRMLNTITHLPAGRSLNAIVDLLTELSTADGHSISDPWKLISEAADRVPSTDLEVNLSFFAGSMGDRGHISEVKLENLSVGHLFNAAFDNMAANYSACARRLFPNQHWKQVVLSGGLPQKLPRLRQILARRFTGPIRMPRIAEEALEGLLQLAVRIGASL